MKKIIAMAVVAAVAVSMVCAQITVGAKRTFGMNLGSKVSDEAKEIFARNDDAKNAFMVNSGDSIYGRYNLPFLPALPACPGCAAGVWPHRQQRCWFES